MSTNMCIVCPPPQVCWRKTIFHQLHKHEMINWPTVKLNTWLYCEFSFLFVLGNTESLSYNKEADWLNLALYKSTDTDFN